jgi:hypothetical protein
MRMADPRVAGASAGTIAGLRRPTYGRSPLEFLGSRAGLDIKALNANAKAFVERRVHVEDVSTVKHNTVQDRINLVCGALLFISPWVLGFAGDMAAARTDGWAAS